MRIHISRSIGEIDKSKTYIQPEPYSINNAGIIPGTDVRKWKQRPVGLWYAFGSDWTELLQEHYQENNLVSPNTHNGRSFEIDITNAKILQIDSLESLNYLNKHYPEVAGDDWRAISRDYDGIEVKNLKSLLELGADEEVVQEHCSWLGKLEIDSGCVWNLKDVGIIDLPEVSI